MKNFEFVIWLRGYLELCPDVPLNRKKLFIIKNHLNLVKAVEGELGPLNQEIYDLVSNQIEKDGDLQRLKIKISEMTSELLADIEEATSNVAP